MASLSSLWPQRKPGRDTGASPKRERPQQQSAAPPSAPRKGAAHAQPQGHDDSDDDVLADEQMLRQFDLASKFGPCTGMTRLQRFDRAQRFGLDPPQHVHDIIMANGGAGSASDLNVWHDRV